MGDLIFDLQANVLELRETHISWVLLGEGEVLKLKKPVDFGFLDFTSLEKRRRACESEVVLNTRLAPDVYLGVVPVTRGADGVHRIGGEGEPVDFAVHMRRLRDADRADVRLDAGRLAWADLEALVDVLVRFHARAATSEAIAAFGSVECIAQNVEENFAQAGGCLQRLASEAAEREVEAAQLAFLRERAGDFERRVRLGKVRDGHGDLRLEHVYFPERGAGAEAEPAPAPVVIDCIEFNERSATRTSARTWRSFRWTWPFTVGSTTRSACWPPTRSVATTTTCTPWSTSTRAIGPTCAPRSAPWRSSRRARSTLGRASSETLVAICCSRLPRSDPRSVRRG
jgi:aminoglycoside phosphotransferase family enzyme